MSKLVRRFEDLVAWQKAMDLTIAIYDVSAKGPFARDFALSNQIHRASVSISSNIAEGFERGSRREFRHFLSIAKGSCGEVRTQVHLALRLRYVSQETHDSVVALTEEVSRKIGKLRSTLTTPSTRHSSPVTRHSSVTRH